MASPLVGVAIPLEARTCCPGCAFYIEGDLTSGPDDAAASEHPDPRIDGFTRYALRVRIGGGDDIVQLGNSCEGWDESRVDRAHAQLLLAKIELGLWTPGGSTDAPDGDAEPTFRELATE